MPALSGVIFSFQFRLFFFNISLGRPHQHGGLGLLFVLIRNIGHRTLPNIWVGTFLVRNVHSREKTELILTVKMETKHPIEGPFTSELPAICYFVNFVSIFCVFLGKSIPLKLPLLRRSRPKSARGQRPTFG